jgi:acyl carrier protein
LILARGRGAQLSIEEATVSTVGQRAIVELVRSGLAEYLQVGPETISDTARFQEDLALDSLDVTELLVRLVMETGVELEIQGADDLDEMSTVGGFARVFARAMSADQIETLASRGPVTRRDSTFGHRDADDERAALARRTTENT